MRGPGSRQAGRPLVLADVRHAVPLVEHLHRAPAKPFVAFFCPLIPRIGDVLAEQPHRSVVPARRRDRDRPRPGPQVTDERLCLGRAPTPTGTAPRTRPAAAPPPPAARSSPPPAGTGSAAAAPTPASIASCGFSGTTPLRQLQPRAARQSRSTHPKPPVASAATLMHGSNRYDTAAQQPEITACHDPDASTSGEFKPLPDTAECCVGCNKARISNQVTRRPPRRRRQPHRAARPATS